jgi:hypothetical protein
MKVTLKAAALLASSAAVALPFIAAAEAAVPKHAVNMKASGGTISGTNAKDVKFKGKPFGSCTMDVAFNGTTATDAVTCPKGKFRMTCKLKASSTQLSGPCTFSRGTGKFKGISGTVREVYTISSGTGTFKGTVRY